MNSQRLLVDRDAADIAPLLEATVRGASDVGRLHSLWTLEGIGRLSPDVIRSTFQSSEPGLRENAIRLAERHLDEAMQHALYDLADDPDAGVRFQLLLTLGFVDTPRAAGIRNQLLFRDIDDEWMQVAALSASSPHDGDVLESVIATYQPSYASFLRRLTMLAAFRRPWERVQELLADAATVPSRAAPSAPGAAWQAPVLESMAQGLRTRDDVAEAIDLGPVVDAFLDHPSVPVRDAALGVLRATGLPPQRADAVDRAVTIARDTEAPPDRRAQAIGFLVLDDPDRHAPVMMDLIAPDQPSSVQSAAFHALGAAAGTNVGRIATERWLILTREVRDAALDAILDRPFQLDRITILLDALEAGIVQPANLGWRDQVTLMRDIPEDMKQRPRALITGPEKATRQATAEFVRDVRSLTPDPRAGREVFLQACSRCHSLAMSLRAPKSVLTS